MGGRYSHGNASLHGSINDVHFRDGAELVSGVAGEQDIHQRGAGRQHHGPHTDGEHHAFRHVHVTRESRGRGGDRSRLGGPDAHALHTEHAGAMGSRRAYGAVGEHAHAGQHISTDVHLGRRDYVCYTRGVYGDGAVG